MWLGTFAVCRRVCGLLCKNRLFWREKHISMSSQRHLEVFLNTFRSLFKHFKKSFKTSLDSFAILPRQGYCSLPTWFAYRHLSPITSQADLGAFIRHVPKLDSSFLKNGLSFSQKWTVIFPKMYCHFFKKTVHFWRIPFPSLRVGKWIPLPLPALQKIFPEMRQLTFWKL